MNAGLVWIYLHLVASVVLSGYVLFWLVMSFTLRADRGGLKSEATLLLIGRSRWPPFGLPAASRIPLVAVGWLLVLFMVASGSALLTLRGLRLAQLASPSFWTHGFGLVITAKAALLALFAAAHYRLAVRPTRGAAVAAGLLLAAILCASALLV